MEKIVNAILIVQEKVFYDLCLTNQIKTSSEATLCFANKYLHYGLKLCGGGYYCQYFIGDKSGNYTL
jgi:hypothetical protein